MEWERWEGRVLIAEDVVWGYGTETGVRDCGTNLENVCVGWGWGEG